MRLIGLTGKAGVGKDTVAQYLVDQHTFRQMAFADSLKAMILCLGAPLPETREDKEGDHPIFGVSWRKLMQTLGTEWMREIIHPDGWVLIMEERLKWVTDQDIVISDVRFENEAKWIRDNGGVIWHIFREVPGVREHSSENGIEFDVQRDLMLDNNGTIDALQGNIEWLLND